VAQQTQPTRLNELVAEKLSEASVLLEGQDANPFRVAAYRKAAEVVAALESDVYEILEQQGVDGLLRLPHIGHGIAAAIVEIVTTGRWSRLERWRGALDPVALFQTVPGVGPELARRIHDTLHVDTLEGLEAAAHDGSLASIPGLGPRRIATIQATLGALLGRVRLHRVAPSPGPSVKMLLSVDEAYRRSALAGTLPMVAPKRFNPRHEAWLPILHTQRGAWHFTALFSNTARAHDLKKTRDWVVVYFYDGDHREGQHTIVTETRGPLAGQRVVRGLAMRGAV
jgi:hypothetical protein